MYVYRWYSFPTHTAFLEAWATAGLPISEDSEPYLAPGAVDMKISDAGCVASVAWQDAANPALTPHEVAWQEGMQSFAGWNTPAPPAPVPSQVDNASARVVLMRTPSKTGIPGRSLFDDIDGALKALGGEALQFWEYANKIYRYDSPLIASLAANFGMTDADLDALFRAADAVHG